MSNKKNSSQNVDWSDDAFLDSLRLETDKDADHVLGLESPQAINDMIATLAFNHSRLPEKASVTLQEFWRRADGLPKLEAKPGPGGHFVDLDRIDRGQQVFWQHAFPAALVLVTKSMIEGYAAPNLTKVLCLSEKLVTDTYRRLIHTLGMLVNVSNVHSFEQGEHDERETSAIVTAKKLRLLHAALRRDMRSMIAGTSGEESFCYHNQRRDIDLTSFREDHQEPLNKEDMLGVIMGLSLLVIDGLEKLRVGLTEEEAEDYYYVWRGFALKMGVHPPNAPNDDSYIPTNVEEARTFYTAFKRRHYRPREDNPEGVKLTKAQIKALNQNFFPWWLRWLGVPRAYMRILVGPEICRQVGIRRRPWHPPLEWILLSLPRWWQSLLGDRIHGSKAGEKTTSGDPFYEALGQRIFGKMIQKELGERQVKFTVKGIKVEDTRDRRQKDRPPDKQSVDFDRRGAEAVLH